MIYQARFFKVANFYVAYLWILISFGTANAQEIFYFSNQSRDLEVSANAESLLTFPAPPFARVCQPSGIVDLYPLDEARELDALLLPRGLQSPDVSGLSTDSGPGHQSSTPEFAQLANHLKLVPKRAVGTAVCAIRLTNEQVINVRFVLSNSITTPIIEFRSLMNKAKSGAVLSRALGPINLFRSLVSGGDLTFLADETPQDNIHTGRNDQGHSRKLGKVTGFGYYQLIYVGTDKDLYKAWKFEGKAEQDFPSSLALRDPRLGDIYFSVFKAKTAENNSKSPLNSQKKIRKGDDFTFYVLSRGDISPSEMMERLP